MIIITLVKNFLLVRLVKKKFDFGHSGCRQGPISAKKCFGQNEGLPEFFFWTFFGSHNVLGPLLRHIKNLGCCFFLWKITRPGVNICPKNPKVFPPEKEVFPKKLLIFSAFNIFNQISERRSFSHRNTPCFKTLERKNSSLKV